MKGKTRIVLLFLILFLIIGGGIILLLVTSEEKGKQQQQSEKDSAKKMETEWEQFDLLEAYLTNDQIEKIKRESREFLTQNETFNGLEKVVCKDVTETENYVEFYCVLGTDEGILYGQYNKKTGDLFKWTEEENSEQAKEKWMQKKNRTISTKEWEEEEKLPKEWNYIEEDSCPVMIENRETLVEEIGEENTEQLEENLLEFLKGQNEFRREFVLNNYTEDPEMGNCECILAFKTERLDKNVIKVAFDQETGKYQFDLIGGDE